MYAYIKGRLIEISPLHAVVDAQGIGYKMFVPANALPRMPQIGEQVMLYTSWVVREFSQTLYGFPSSQERDLFEALMNVNGIGPKLALSLIGHMSLSEFQAAIAHNDLHTIIKVPGVGKKTAERLVVELRDKLAQLFPHDPSEFMIKTPSDPKSQAIQDAMSALIHLGYHQNIAQKAIKKTLQEFPEGIDLPSLITHSLKNI